VREEEARLKKLIADYEALQKRFEAAGAKPRKQNGTFVQPEDEQEYKRLEGEVEAARRRMQEQEARTVDAEAARLDYQKRLREMEVANQKSLRESNERLEVKRQEMRSVGETPAERIGRLKIRSSDYIDSLLIMGDELDEIEDKEWELRRMLNQTQGEKRKEIETQLAELAQERLRKEKEIADTKVAQLDIDKQIREYEIQQARQEAARSMQGMASFFSPALPDLVRRGGSMQGTNGPAEANLKILNAVLIANRYLQYIRINTANGGVY
jgi:chromosome segregation ATPase